MILFDLPLTVQIVRHAELPRKAVLNYLRREHRLGINSQIWKAIVTITIENTEKGTDENGIRDFFILLIVFTLIYRINKIKKKRGKK